MSISSSDSESDIELFSSSNFQYIPKKINQENQKNCPKLELNHQNILKKYGRQLLVKNLGSLTGYKNLYDTKILIIGAGGIGSSLCYYLASSGASITIIDGDSIEESNLHRQIIHKYSRIGKNKAESAALSCLQLNSLCKISFLPYHLTIENIDEVFSGGKKVKKEDNEDNYFTSFNRDTKIYDDEIDEINLDSISSTSFTNFTIQENEMKELENEVADIDDDKDDEDTSLGYDLILDATDNIETRLLINDYLLNQTKLNYIKKIQNNIKKIQKIIKKLKIYYYNNNKQIINKSILINYINKINFLKKENVVIYNLLNNNINLTSTLSSDSLSSKLSESFTSNFSSTSDSSSTTDSASVSTPPPVYDSIEAYFSSPSPSSQLPPVPTYKLNNYLLKHSQIYVSAAAITMDATITTIIPYFTPCYRCINFPTEESDKNNEGGNDGKNEISDKNLINSNELAGACSNLGVFGPIPGLIGILMAIEAIKIAVSLPKHLIEKKNEKEKDLNELYSRILEKKLENNKKIKRTNKNLNNNENDILLLEDYDEKFFTEYEKMLKNLINEDEINEELEEEKEFDDNNEFDENEDEDEKELKKIIKKINYKKNINEIKLVKKFNSYKEKNFHFQKFYSDFLKNFSDLPVSSDSFYSISSSISSSAEVSPNSSPSYFECPLENLSSSFSTTTGLSDLSKDFFTNNFQFYNNSQLIFDGNTGQFHRFNLINRQNSCKICGKMNTNSNKKIKNLKEIQLNLLKLKLFLIQKRKNYIGKIKYLNKNNIKAEKFLNIINHSKSLDTVSISSKKLILILDVRSTLQFNLSNLSNKDMKTFSSIDSCLEYYENFSFTNSLSSSASSSEEMVYISIPLLELKKFEKIKEINNSYTFSYTTLEKLKKLFYLFELNQFLPSSLTSSLSTPLTKDTLYSQYSSFLFKHSMKENESSSIFDYYILCRRGNDSIIGTNFLLENFFSSFNPVNIEKGIEILAKFDRKYSAY